MAVRRAPAVSCPATSGSPAITPGIGTTHQRTRHRETGKDNREAILRGRGDRDRPTETAAERARLPVSEPLPITLVDYAAPMASTSPTPPRPTPVGPGCRVCERLDLPQRAAPPLGHPLRIDQNTSTFVP
ncbi:short-chain fatty acyl-CoA regulator family protein [Streptomyces canus]|uniref:short-chain fatty acyl-CoA regulator family protein n=1 Tax=Streptomyces canus TaxID=58343 RepID=UPI0037D9BE4D